MAARACVVGAVLAAFAVAAPPARADGDRPERITRSPRLFVAVERLVPLLSYSRISIESVEGSVTTSASDSGTSIAFSGREPSLGAAYTIPRLAVDLSVRDGLTIGTGIVLAFGLGGTHAERRESLGTATVERENDAPSATIVGFTPRLGYLVALGSRFALWPRLGFGFHSTTTTSEQSSSSAVARATSTDTLFSLTAETHVMWTPFEHLFVLGGPVFDVPLLGSHATEFSQAGISKERSDDLRTFHVGLSLGAGIWLDP